MLFVIDPVKNCILTIDEKEKKEELEKGVLKKYEPNGKIEISKLYKVENLIVETTFNREMIYDDFGR